MAILVPRKRIIETFAAKELANASRKMLNNTDAYRALQGDIVFRCERNLESLGDFSFVKPEEQVKRKLLKREK